ncbi:MULTISPECIES: GntR family transcriptional regulator [Alteribacter]|uniref:GntR family transcriptional regulator n=1 Tax=Alteribacter keqinensis TaxID=2483800 RepID=A0A3M7TSK8_9BACI|nr:MULTISPECIES: GntR family transcriptional regulator [Alteribacter]MBM7097478.1 GntR family transcriptional regulator [Alteribacter salitolerans]RNA68586.1 GntR family transcriptional regulator [Alteribacter keqinensis]
MIINPDGAKPIYVQISEWIETEILNGNFTEDEKVYSQYQLAEMMNINPATAAKGLTKLVEEDILYKKRGLGMFVAAEAKGIILNKRKTNTLTKLVEDVVAEANHLNVSESELITMIKTSMSETKGEKS